MHAPFERIDVGDRAPDFQLPDHRGEPLRLSILSSYSFSKG